MATPTVNSATSTPVTAVAFVRSHASSSAVRRRGRTSSAGTGGAGGPGADDRSVDHHRGARPVVERAGDGPRLVRGARIRGGAGGEDGRGRRSAACDHAERRKRDHARDPGRHRRRGERHRRQPDRHEGGVEGGPELARAPACAAANPLQSAPSSAVRAASSDAARGGSRSATAPAAWSWYASRPRGARHCASSVLPGGVFDSTDR